MPNWWVEEPNDTLFLSDRPFFYNTGRGKELAFEMHLKNSPGVNGTVDTKQPAIFCVGTNWHTPWRSYLQPIHKSDGTYDPSIFFVLLGDGSARQYGLDEFDSISRLALSYNSTTAEYSIAFPLGSQNVYGQWVTLGTNNFCFISKKIDQEGNITTFSYRFTTNSTSGVTNTVRLDKVTDPDGRQTTFAYTNQTYYSNLLTEVHGPGGEVVRLTYNSQVQLTNIVDVVTNSSSMAYDSNGKLSQLITPYGTNQFTYYTGTGGWTATRIDELGLRHQLFLQGFGITNVLPTAYSEAIALNTVLAGAGSATVETTTFQERNTFYWGPLQYDGLRSNVLYSLDHPPFDPTLLNTNDCKLGRTRHWLGHYNLTNILVPGDILSAERGPSPDGVLEGMLTFYDHAYKSGSNNEIEGSTAPILVSPSVPRAVAFREPGGDWSATYFERNLNNNPTLIKDTASARVYDFGLNYSVWAPVWRTRTYTYAANRMDLAEEHVVIDGADTVVSVNAFNNFHQIVTNYNALGEVTRYEYNTNHQITRITSPSSLVTDYSYTNGLLLSVTDSGATSLRTRSYTWTNGYMRTMTDELGLTTTFDYDKLGRLLRQYFPDGTGFTNIYDRLDRIVSYDRMGFTNCYGYNGFRQLIRETNANFKGTTYQYCNCGTLNAITNAVGNITLYSHDNLGRTLRTTFPDLSWVENTFSVLGEIVRITDSAGLNVTNKYDPRGLPVLRTTYKGAQSRLIYDTEDHATNTLDGQGVMAIQRWDLLGRLVKRRVVDYTNAGGSQDEGYAGNTDGYAYSARGMIASTNPIGRVTFYAYDELGRKVAETNANNEVSLFGYSPAGELITLTDAKSQVTRWNYDQYRRLTNKVDAANNVIFRYTYDGNGRLVTRWTPGTGGAGITTSYSYDAIGNLTLVNYPTSHNITFQYDGLNRLTSMNDAAGTSTYAYTSFGALQSEDAPWSNDTITYSYSNRRRASLSLDQPNASPWTLSYGYDAVGRLSTISGAAGSFGYQYHDYQLDQNDLWQERYGPQSLDMLQVVSSLAGRINLPSGAYVTNAYDIYGRLAGTTLKNSSDIALNTHQYGYDPASRRTNSTRWDGSSVAYGYDNIGQLASALGTEPGGTTNRWQERFFYAYDAAGNLNKRVQNVLTNVFNVNTLNELASSVRTNTSLTVAGTSTSTATNVTVAANGGGASNAIRYADATFARTNVTLANGTNTFVAVAQDNLGRADTNTVVTYLPI